MKTVKDKELYKNAVMAALWLAVWGIAAMAADSDLILPGPVSTFRALAALVAERGFWLNVAWTLFRVALGIAISFAAGSVCAVFASRNRMLRDLLKIPVSFFKSIPVMAIIIYVILIVKADWVAVVVCFLMCFPIAYTNMVAGLSGMRKDLDEAGTVLGMSRKQKWSIIERPELQPQISASVDLISGMSWKVVVASEVLAIPEHSIGYQMLNSKYYLETPDLFAYMIVLIVLSLAMGKALSYLAEADYRNAGRRVREEVKNADRPKKKSAGPEVILRNVSKSFMSEDGTRKAVLEYLDMDFSPGITALAGPSGEGKTTIARLIMGLDHPDSGEVTVRPDISPDVLFQEDRLFPWLTARENMMLAFIDHAEDDPDAAVAKMAEKLELTDSLDKKPDELSGGMAHRAALGRALLGGSMLLILDEPMRGLDQDLKERVIGNIKEDLVRGADGRERTVVMITHDRELAADISDRVIEL